MHNFFYAYYLLRHVPILYASIEQLEVAGKKVPSREVMCTAKELMTSHHFLKHAHWIYQQRSRRR